jgi:hypothetical protein
VPPSTSSSAAEQRLLAEFETYDQHVDVVSALEWLFTEVKDMGQTVAHFERFPRIAAGGRTLTPDFTVLIRKSSVAGQAAGLRVTV